MTLFHVIVTLKTFEWYIYFLLRKKVENMHIVMNPRNSWEMQRIRCYLHACRNPKKLNIVTAVDNSIYWSTWNSLSAPVCCWINNETETLCVINLLALEKWIISSLILSRLMLTCFPRTSHTCVFSSVSFIISNIVSDVLIAALADTLSEHPELVATAKEGLSNIGEKNSANSMMLKQLLQKGAESSRLGSYWILWGIHEIWISFYHVCRIDCYN